MAKVKIPKRIAGVKLPKKVRRQAKKLLKLTASPLAREFALAGLTLAAHRLLDGAGTAGEAGAQPGKGRKKALRGLTLGALLEAAAAEGARRFLAGYPAEPAPARRRPGARAGAE